MIRFGDSHEPKPWQSCVLCSDKRIFRTPTDFSRHLRQYHCTKEGGSFVCRYGRNGVCPSLPVEGVSDKDYEVHVERNHAKLEAKQVIIPANHEDSLVPIQRIPPIAFPHEKKFTVYDSNQNLPAVLNDPRSSRRLHDFFTKTWGEEFIPSSVPTLTLLPHIPRTYFDDYLRRIDLGSKVHHKIKKNISEAKSNTDEGAQPGDTGFTAAAIAAAKRQSVPEKVLSDIQQIPKVFMQADFSLEDQQTFNSVLPWALISEPKKSAKDRAGLLNMPRNSAKLLQEKLTYYLDITEVNLAHQISLRSEDFFSAMASQDQLQDHVGETCTEIRHLRMKVKKADNILCHKHLEALRLTSLRSRYMAVFNKLKLMAAVHQTQPTIQLLLSTSDFVAALDLIATTQEVLQQELAGVQSFRHLGSQLAEMERVIERMMVADFKEFIVTNILRPADELFEHGHLVDEDRLVCVLFGLLRKHKFHFIHLYRDEAYTTIKSAIRQTVYGVVSENTDQDEESQSLAEAMRGLDFDQWIKMLGKVFEAATDVLRRMKVLHKGIIAVLAIAAGHGRSQMTSHLDDATLKEIDDDTEDLQTACGDMDILITPSEFTKLSQESRELLCSACEMAQVRCAKLINIRSKAGFLDSLTSAEFVKLTRMVEDFVIDCEGICGRQSHSLRATLLSQAKKFIERFHEERMNKLGLILDNERWKQSDVPAEFQSLVDSLVYGIKPIGRESKFSIAPISQDQRPSSNLVVNGESFTVVGTVLLLLKMVVEYCQCVDDTPMLVTDIMNKLFEILKMFNSRTCQLVLGAGALQLVGLKTITVKHLVLATRCLEVIILHIPTFKSHFEERLPPKQYILLTQFDQILKDYTNHKQELFGKIVSLMDEVFAALFAKWEVKPPMPSQAMRGAVKQVSKLHESVSSVLPEKQIEVLFRDIKRVFKNCLAQKLEILGVFNDGGPQHGLVTSDLAFFAESLKSSKGLNDMGKGLDDIWRIVNELRTSKRARDSPNTVRKSSLPHR